jgi:hypoxanthine phosphoribosyltransferase
VNSQICTLYTADEIKKVISELAVKIKQDYQDKQPVLISILKGSFVFLADLVRELNMPLQVEFVKLSSYQGKKESSGKVNIVQGLKTPIRGRHVLIIEDIVDTGLTISALTTYLQKKRPASIKVCALTDKPSRRQVPVTIDYLGFTVPDKFIVGYGLDWDERYRYLPEICYID